MSAVVATMNPAKLRCRCGESDWILLKLPQHEYGDYHLLNCDPYFNTDPCEGADPFLEAMEHHSQDDRCWHCDSYLSEGLDLPGL